MKDNIITIDGPSASGKGTLARNIAKHLGFEILDSGLLYRVYAYLHDLGIDHSEITRTIGRDISFKSNEGGINVLRENKNITNELRKESTAKSASKISSLPETRKNLISLQRNFYTSKGLVADGRDMGTVVFPNAKLKIFLNASAEVRANRRKQELEKLGHKTSLLELVEEIKKRDLNDKTRKLSPLIPALDSIYIDSSEMTPSEVNNYVKNLLKVL